VTHEELLRAFHYDPDTGVFTNISRRANCVHPGTRAGYVNAKGYRVIKYRQQAYKAHRLAIFYMTGEWPPEQVDHINGDRDDNRYSNLRCADPALNTQNLKGAVSGSSSGLLGAHRGGWKKRRWVAAINVEGRRLYLGIYKTPEEAHQVYLEAKRMLHKGCTI
jgi:hypothetical protein